VINTVNVNGPLKADNVSCSCTTISVYWGTLMHGNHINFTHYLIYKAECLFVCTLYKYTFLNQSQPNFAHIPPGLEETVGYVWSENV
jgi:hypothetical protein